MCKKLTLGVVGLIVVGGLLFGSRVVPYAKTAIQKARASAMDNVPVSFQLEAAKSQLAEIGPEIKNMVHQIAKEKVQIKRLAADMKQHDKMLKDSYNEMMTLREHVQSGEQFYVATNGKAYNTSRVEEDLRHRFALYQTAEKTREKKAEILRIREESLSTAMAKLDQAKAQQRELEVQIENLVARNRMNEVIATASEININNSQLSKTREMLEDIDAVISAKEEVLNIAPKYFGQIPVSSDAQSSDTNILEEMDAYFDGKSSSDTDNVRDHDSNDDDLAIN